MRRTPAILLGIMVLISAASFWSGRAWGSRNIRTYPIHEGSLRRPVSFNLDWPAYGLPLAEYSLLLRNLRSGNNTGAIAKAEVLLDITLYDAIQRRSHLSGQHLARLDQAIANVSDYRRQYPRPIDGNPDVDLAPKIQVEVDEFLRRFNQ